MRGGIKFVNYISQKDQTTNVQENYLRSVLHAVVDGVKDVKVGREVNVVGPVRLLAIIVSQILAQHVLAINDSQSKTSKIAFQLKELRYQTKCT